MGGSGLPRGLQGDVSGTLTCGDTREGEGSEASGGREPQVRRIRPPRRRPSATHVALSVLEAVMAPAPRPSPALSSQNDRQPVIYRPNRSPNRTRDAVPTQGRGGAFEMGRPREGSGAVAIDTGREGGQLVSWCGRPSRSSPCPGASIHASAPVEVRQRLQRVTGAAREGEGTSGHCRPGPPPQPVTPSSKAQRPWPSVQMQAQPGVYQTHLLLSPTARPPKLCAPSQRQLQGLWVSPRRKMRALTPELRTQARFPVSWFLLPPPEGQLPGSPAAGLSGSVAQW